MSLSDTGNKVPACGVDALSKSTAFWLTIEHQGEDSAIWTGLVQDARGAAYRVEFDSDTGDGARDTLSMRVFVCSSMSFNPSATERRNLFSCPIVPVP